MRILIVGGGIAGTTLANLLEQHGMAPVLVEQEHAWSNHGYALALWPLGSRVLRGLGLFDAFQDIGQPLDWYRVFDRRGRPVDAIHLCEHLAPADMIRMIRREDLLHLLADHLHATRVRFGLSPERIRQRGEEVEVLFSNGEEGTYDLVVGCDGFHSTVRRTLLGEVPVRHTGWAGWAWWARDGETTRDAVNEHWAPGRFFETYSTRDATSALAAMPIRLMPPDARHPAHEAVRRAFSVFGAPVHRVLAALRPEDPMFYWEFADVRPTRWYGGRIVLVGDASSALLPSAGVGASCAMESAAVLADELRGASAASVDQALPRYFRRRFARVDRMQRESRLIARLMFTESRLLSGLRNFMLRTTPFAERRLKAINRLLAEPL